MLSCDIDELVLSQGPETIFDATAQSWIGFTRFQGVWRYAADCGDGAVVRHSDHVFRKPGDRPCPPKWCLRPSGPLGKVQWRAHELEGFLFNRALTSSAFLFHHRRQITSGWKRTGSLASEVALISDVAATTLARRPHKQAGAPGPLGASMAAPVSGMKSAARGLIEWASRDFFAWRASRQILVSG